MSSTETLEEDKWPEAPSLQLKIPFGKYAPLVPQDLEQILEMYEGEPYRVNEAQYWSVLKGMKLVALADDNYPTAMVLTWLPLDHCDRKDKDEIPDNVRMNEEYTACLHITSCRFPKDQRDQCRTRIVNKQGEDVWPEIKSKLMSAFQNKQMKKVNALYQTVGEAVSGFLKQSDTPQAAPTSDMEETKEAE